MRFRARREIPRLIVGWMCLAKIASADEPAMTPPLTESPPATETNPSKPGNTSQPSDSKKDSPSKAQDPPAPFDDDLIDAPMGGFPGAGGFMGGGMMGGPMMGGRGGMRGSPMIGGMTGFGGGAPTMGGGFPMGGAMMSGGMEGGGGPSGRRSPFENRRDGSWHGNLMGMINTSNGNTMMLSGNINGQLSRSTTTDDFRLNLQFGVTRLEGGPQFGGEGGAPRIGSSLSPNQLPGNGTFPAGGQGGFQPPAGAAPPSSTSGDPQSVPDAARAAITQETFQGTIGQDWWTSEEQRWLWFVSGSGLHDQFQAYDWRWYAHAGPGLRLLERGKSRLVARVGVGFSQDLGGQASGDLTMEGAVASEWTWRINDGQRLATSLEYYPSLFSDGRYRLNARVSWDCMLFAEKNIFLRLSAQERYQSESYGVRNNDFTTSASIGWGF